MKRFVSAVLAVLLLAIVAGAQEKPNAADKPPAPLTAEQKDKVDQIKVKYLQNAIRMHQIEDQYADKLRQDPDYAKLTRDNTDLSQELQRDLQDFSKDVDKAKWILNPNTLDYDKAPAPAEKK